MCLVLGCSGYEIWSSSLLIQFLTVEVQYRLKRGERMVDLCLDGAVQFACIEIELHARGAVGCACLLVKGDGNYVEVEWA